MLIAARRVLRRLERAPGFACAAVLTLAVGIGASALIFSVIDGVLLEPLPYPESGRIVEVRQVGERGGLNRVSDPNFTDLRDQTSSLDRFAQYTAYEVAIAGGDEPVLAVRADVSSEFFDIVQVRPSQGRLFVAEEQRFGAAPAALVSYSFWQRYLGGAPDPAARSLRIGGSVFSVVGVMPRGFAYPDGAAVWTPRELWPQTGRGAHNFSALGRLAPGVTLDTARREFSQVARRLKTEYGDETWMFDADVATLRDRLVSGVRPALTVLAWAAVLLFGIAAANTVNLMLAHAVTRERDVAVRLALGARPLTIAVEFLGQAVVLCGLGGLAGLLLAWWGAAALSSLQESLLPRASSIRIDASTIALAVGLALAAAAGSSLLVAWRVPRSGLELRSARRATVSREGARLRDGLVATQVAIALVLTVGAVLLGRSYLEVTSVDPGFRSDGMLLVNVTSPYSRDQRAQIGEFHGRVLEGLQRISGGASGGVSGLPSQGSGTNGQYVVLERPDEARDWPAIEALSKLPGRAGYAEYRVASEGYFETLGIPLLRGRSFRSNDVSGSMHVAVVSRSLAEDRWPGQDPLGKVIQFGGMDGDLTPFTIVGVVGDVRDYGLDAEQRPTVYVYYRQRPAYADSMWFAMRVAAPESAIAGVRELVRGIDPDVPTEFLLSDGLYAESIAQRRFNLTMLAVFGGAALALALGGIYAAVAFGVARRAHEIGVRIAVGATLPRVVALVVGRSVGISALGVVAGAAVAFAAAQVFASLLYGIRPHDPVSYALAAAVLLTTAVGAALIPALRAARIDPIATLRDD
jgi:putative ABC transport system permease protein